MKPDEAPMTYHNRNEADVLNVLKDGGSLRFFGADSAVAVHTKDNAPAFECPIEIFQKLGRERKIRFVRNLTSGRPHYADETTSEVYKLNENE